MAFKDGKFAFATVLDVKVYESDDDVMDTPLLELDSLRISNLTTEGPNKTYKGGKYAKTLLRYGKTARLEMEDAIGSAEMIKIFFGAVVDDATGKITISNTYSNKTYKIVGETFVINDKTGEKEFLELTFFQFLPDGNLNLTLEAEGDFAIFNLAGELLADDETGDFYTIESKEAIAG